MSQKIRSEVVEYTDPLTGDEFQGVMSWDAGNSAKKPGILVSHAYAGQLELEEKRTIELAEKGYFAFALDVYGKGRRANNPDEAGELMAEMNADRGLLLQRMQLALHVLKSREQVDTSKLGAIGFCFGGKCVLDLARSGVEDVQGVVSFHGLFDKPQLNHEGDIKASVLVQHGWIDPLATPEEMRELADELEARNADWQIQVHGQAGHAFTNPAASDKQSGLFYQALAHKRSWDAMLRFFDELFHDD